MHNIQFTICTLYSFAESLHWLYTLHFTLYTLHFILYTLHFTLYTLHFALYTLHFILVRRLFAPALADSHEWRQQWVEEAFEDQTRYLLGGARS